MPTNSAFVFISPNDHSHSIPANKAFYSSFNFSVAREWRLFFPRNGIYIRSICSKRDTNSRFMGSDLELLENFLYSFRTSMLKHIIECIEPFFSFQVIYFYVLIIAHKPKFL